MTCSDYPRRAAAGPKLAKRDSTNDACCACHAEEAQPFVHSHEPVAQLRELPPTRTAAPWPRC